MCVCVCVSTTTGILLSCLCSHIVDIIIMFIIWFLLTISFVLLNLNLGDKINILFATSSVSDFIYWSMENIYTISMEVNGVILAGSMCVLHKMYNYVLRTNRRA